jgi:DNA-binding response OmpR family regulator|tara:strand:+ start:1335 stop:1970 length:636 start_codon:yes stop_codon:yes gene_type:complete
MENNLLVFGTKNFNNSLSEIKEYLNFPLVFFNKNDLSESSTTKINFVIVDSDVCNDIDIVRSIKKIKNKPLLLLKKKYYLNTVKLTYDDVIILPSSLIEISNKIISLITSKKFNQNSFVKIKEYAIDKNERKLKQENLSMTITEREIQLIELLFNEKKPVPKSIILKRVWKYADDADTHTIETHIYRLRKKILDVFKDDNFIINSKDGYSI